MDLTQGIQVDSTELQEAVNDMAEAIDRLGDTSVEVTITTPFGDTVKQSIPASELLHIDIRVKSDPDIVEL